MGKGKALVLGSSLLLAGTSMANSNDLFATNDLGAAKEIKCQILDINGVDDSTINFSPNELCCAYGSPTDFKKQDRKWKRQDRKRARQEKRKSK